MKLPLAVLTLLCPALAGAQNPNEPRTTFPAATELVTVDAVVDDRQGAPVLGLRVEDFTVTEDGIPQEVTAFEAVTRPPVAQAANPTIADKFTIPDLTPRVSSNVDAAGREGRTFVVLFDELHLDLAEAGRGRAAVAEFLRTGVGDRDRVVLVGTAEGTRWTARIPEGREALLGVLGRLQGRRVGEMQRDEMSDYEAMRIDRDSDPIVTERVVRRFKATGAIHVETRLRGDSADQGENLGADRETVRARAAQVYARAAAQNETTLGILERAVASLSAVRGRKSVILVSGGLVQDGHLDGFRRVVVEARRANAALYFLDARGLTAATSSLSAESGVAVDFNDLGSTLTEGRERSEGTEGLAADTGGFSVRNENDLKGGIARIARESASYYLLGYAPANKRADGRFRKIEVKVAREGLKVRARRGYYAPGGRAPKTAPETRDAAMQRSLDSPFDLGEVPLRAIAHAFEEAQPGKVRVFVTVEADIRGLAFEERGGSAKDTLELLLVIANRETGEFHRFDQQLEMSFRPETRARYAKTWFPIAREAPLVPGGYQARIVVRDKNSGRMGTLTHDFVVPSSTGLRLSSPILSDRLREDGPDPGRNPLPIAYRTFAPAGMLHVRFEVYGAAKDKATGLPHVTAGFSIRRADGRFLGAAPETPVVPGPDGALVRTLGTSLEGVPAGRYELIVVVTDVAAGQVAEAREPFEVEAKTE